MNNQTPADATSPDGVNWQELKVGNVLQEGDVWRHYVSSFFQPIHPSAYGTKIKLNRMAKYLRPLPLSPALRNKTTELFSQITKNNPSLL